MEIVKVKGLSKTYGQGDNKVVALDNVSLSIMKGSFVAIVGASGSGKSTLLHLLGGLDRPSTGEVIVDGTNIYSLTSDALAIFRRRKVGLIFQAYNLIPVLTAEENIEMPLFLDGRKRDATLRKETKELLKTLSLTTRQHHLPSQLSGGQQQRVAIGRALIHRPAIILADEPTGNLDSTNSQDVLDVLRYSVKKYNQTLVLITHDPQVAKVADRVITLKDGRILKDEVIA